MSEIVKNNNNMTSLENDSANGSKDDGKIKTSSNRRSSAITSVAVARGVSGVVKWFSVYKGYGFITRDDDETDIFFHLSAIVRGGRYYNAPIEDEKVVFDVVQGFKGPEAWTVTGTDGKPVHGVRLLTNYSRTFNNANKAAFRSQNGRRRRSNLNRDDDFEVEEDEEEQGEELLQNPQSGENKISKNREVNEQNFKAKVDSSANNNDKPKNRKNSSNKSAKRFGKSKEIVSNSGDVEIVS